jgi:ADP-ribose pyrophosphatase YjhB (NUDIX family)
MEAVIVLMRLSSFLSRSPDIVTLGVQGVLVDDQSRVLLVRHGYRPGWHFPGGGVERGEEIEAALAREVLEETGAIITHPAELIGVYSHFHEYPGDHVVLFMVRNWRRDSVPKPNTEIAEQGFYALDRLPPGVSQGTSRRLAELFGGMKRSHAW